MVLTFSCCWTLRALRKLGDRGRKKTTIITLLRAVIQLWTSRPHLPVSVHFLEFQVHVFVLYLAPCGS